jgi:hypothetical protein
VDPNGNLVPNRGTPISVVEEKRLKQFWYYCRYCYMTKRIPNFNDPDDIPTSEMLDELDNYISAFPESKDVAKPPQFPGHEKARKWYESFEEWAAKTIGPSGVPLSYVLRESHTQGEDEGLFEPTMDEDLYNRGRHNTPSTSVFWKADNTMVWNQLRECFHPTKDYTWLKPYEKSKDGHAGFWAGK